MFRVLISKTYRFHDCPPVWAPEPSRSQRSDPGGVPEMYWTLITKTDRFHDFLPVWALEPFRSKNSDPRGVPEMYRTVITKTYRFHDFLPVWALEPSRSQNSDPRGVPEMCRSWIYQKPFDSMIFSRLGSGVFSEPKIGSERGAKTIGFQYQKHIDSMIFFSFVLRIIFGAKNLIREGCYKCTGL